MTVCYYQNVNGRLFILEKILIVALYRHYKRKRGNFGCILQRMEQQIELSCILVPILCMLVVCI